MSWWVIDTVSVNENGDECLCDIQCDAAADLPAANQISTIGYTIVRGSKALDLATGDRYIMESSGSWVKQPSEYQLDLTGYATELYVDDIAATKQDALSASQLAAANSGITAAKLIADEAALVELNDFIFGLGTALSAGDDLNSLTYAVRAYASTGTIAAAILNTPWTASGFTVWAMPFIVATNFIQILIPNTSGGKWYKRRYTSGSWGSWIEYDGMLV